MFKCRCRFAWPMIPTQTNANHSSTRPCPLLQIGRVRLPQDPCDNSKPMIVLDMGALQLNLNTKLTEQRSPDAMYHKFGAKLENVQLAMFPTCDSLSLKAVNAKRQLLSEVVMTVDLWLLEQDSISTSPDFILDIDIEVRSQRVETASFRA